MNISSFFIKKPLAGFVLFFFLCISGVWGFYNTQVKLYPDVDSPVINTNIVVLGMTAEQLQTEVASVVEDKLLAIDKISHVQTHLYNNVANFVITFDLSKNEKDALNDVKDALAQIRGQLPASAKDPVVSAISVTPRLLFIYQISSHTKDPLSLSRFVDTYLKQQLSSVKGVGNFYSIGGVHRQANVWLDSDKLAVNQLSVSQVVYELANAQQSLASGDTAIDDRPVVMNTVRPIEQFADIARLSFRTPSGKVVQIGDISHVEDSIEQPWRRSFFNGQPSIAFAIERAKGAGDIDTGSAVRAKIDEILQKNPDLVITEVLEKVSGVENDFHQSMDMLYEGAVLAIFVVLLFLGGMRPTLMLLASSVAGFFAYPYLKAPLGELWAILLGIAIVLVPVFARFDNYRSTIVSAIALPLSILPTFAGMYLLDISLNIMSTLALSLVVGILVDDAIVEVENIDRHMKMGKSAYSAAMEAADEIGIAVIAITFTLIAVFLPTAFMPGIAGKFFFEFGVTASLAIFSSLAVARIITPSLSAYFLKPSGHIIEKNSLIMTAYLHLVRITTGFRWITIILSLGFFIYSLSVMLSLPKGLLPSSDEDYTMVSIELPEGSISDETEQKVREIRDLIKDHQAILNTFTDVNGRFATLYINFIAKKERNINNSEIKNELRQRVQGVRGAKISIASGGFGEKFQMLLAGSDRDLLNKVAREFIAELKTIDKLANVQSSFDGKKRELLIEPDYRKMALLGINPRDIANTLRLATRGDYSDRLPKFDDNQKQIPIVARLPKEHARNIERLENLLVYGSTGAVRIGTIAKLSVQSVPEKIERYDRNNIVEINAEIKGGTLGEIKAEINRLPSLQNLPSSISIIERGESEVMSELIQSFVVVMGFAVLAIYGVLVLLFGKLIQPITILFGMPLSIGGAVLGLVLINSDLSMSAMIGFLMLMGIAVKNSILLVEYIIECRQHNPHINRLDAVLDACCKRARPIIMTTIAMGAGMLPIILELGDGDYGFRRPMAVAVFGGLMTSTFLSLVVIPALYTIMDDFATLIKKPFKSKEQLSTSN